MPFRLKIFAAILGAQLLLLIPVAMFGIRFIGDTAVRIGTDQAIASAHLLARTLAEPLLFYDLARIDEIMDALVQDPSMVSASVLTPEGEVLAPGGSDPPGPAAALGDEAVRASLRDGRTIHAQSAETRALLVPILAGAELVGVLDLRSDNRGMSGAIATARRLAVLGVVFGLVVAIALSQVLSRRLSHRLSDLRRASEALGTGDLASRVALSGNDEFAELGRAFNEMADRIESARADLESRALNDGLTGLPNRRCFDQEFAARLARASERSAAAGVLIRMDLDRFKHVNDTLGHEAGDAVLLRVAGILRESLRSGDLAARVGGDEFSLLMAPGATQAEAEALVSTIQARLSEPLLYDGRPCRFGASFGVACVPDFLAAGTDLNLFADAALYRAKEAGRNRLELFTPSLHRQILRDRQLAIEIQEGLDREEFMPFFHPQVAADDHRLVGAETLLRWNHPAEGLLAPADFMHVAEQLRLVPDIDALMMNKTREALRRWRAQGIELPRISFNVSAGRIHDPEVVSVARSLASEGTRVAFELLESILVEEEDEVFHFNLDRVREAGVDIEIDDFGSGHASILGLMQIAPSALKIDRRIVAPLTEAPDTGKLVRAIIEIAETLGIATVAEGVETADQAQILRDLGCDTLQGFHFARPMSEAEFSVYIRASERRSA